MDPPANLSSWDGPLEPAAGLPGAAALGAVLSLLGAAGAAGNLYTLAVARAGAAPSALRGHIVHLALADLLYLAGLPFVVHNGLAQDWHFGEAGCRALLGLDLLTMQASALLLTLLSTERCRAVRRPFRAARRSAARRHALAAAAWAAAFALALPMMLMVRQEERVVGDGRARRLCVPTWDEAPHKTYLTLLFGTTMAGPGLALGYLYGRLARAYWRSQTQGVLGPRRRPRQRVFLPLFLIVLAFWACFLPFWLWQLVPLYSPGTAAHLPAATEIYVNFLVTCLTYTNSCIDPFLYTLLTRTYRQYLRARRAGRGGAQRTLSTGH
ncbi:LOW QUALITY PROTEIN: urotensin-2 receptor-like [Pelodiscus sinensis]|uniref:LOW QUALITY PROTEIN: urotensin-2 receptor-like n=1 Tax=Pelodiscus sinensis TaxID=13735 RepID=UPI003F6DA216